MAHDATVDAPLRLGVNVDHVATLRQARGTAYPDPVDAAGWALAGGAASITVHLREDRRHIQDRDVAALVARRVGPVNLEMALTAEMLAVAERLGPRDACLVPEKRAELTTEGGLDVVAGRDALAEGLARLGAAGIRAAVFIDPDVAQIRAAAAAGAPAIELHTGAYADAPDPATRERELARVRASAELAAGLGLEVHAGHGLTRDNVGAIAAIADIVELNIGHALIADAVRDGLAAAVRAMRAAMDAGRGR